MINVLKAIVIAAAIAIIAIRMCEVSDSKDGLWTACPHSGFSPDSY